MRLLNTFRDKSTLRDGPPRTDYIYRKIQNENIYRFQYYREILLYRVLTWRIHTISSHTKLPLKM